MKICPQCGLQAPSSALACVQCSHIYHTALVTPVAAAIPPVMAIPPITAPTAQAAFACPRCGSGQFVTVVNQTDKRSEWGLAGVGLLISFLGFCILPVLILGLILTLAGVVHGCMSGRGGVTNMAVTVCSGCGLSIHTA